MKAFIKLTLMLILVMGLFAPQPVCANMAAPKEADVGSSIIFEKNDAVSCRL